MISIGGARYFLTFIDDFSQKTWVYVLKSKSKVLPSFKKWNLDGEAIGARSEGS